MTFLLLSFSCATTEPSPPPFEELSEEYFDSPLMAAVSSEQIKDASMSQTIQLVRKGSVQPDVSKSHQDLAALGIQSEASSGCNCDTVKVCQGEDVPEAHAGVLAKTERILPPQAHAVGVDRYYYLRSCDTSPEELAFFIWGDRSRGQELLQSVGGESKWTPGRAVRYKSPKSSGGMQSFFADHPSTTKTYRVQPGDNLATIAVKVYGDQRSWRELAVENNIQSPDQLKVGQLLKLRYKE